MSNCSAWSAAASSGGRGSGSLGHGALRGLDRVDDVVADPAVLVQQLVVQDEPAEPPLDLVAQAGLYAGALQRVDHLTLPADGADALGVIHLEVPGQACLRHSLGDTLHIPHRRSDLGSVPAEVEHHAAVHVEPRRVELGLEEERRVEGVPEHVVGLHGDGPEIVVGFSPRAVSPERIR